MMFRRKPVPAGAREMVTTHTFIAPSKGLVTNENLTASTPGGAVVLDNFFPTLKSIRLRAGSSKHATVSAKAVESFVSYRSGVVEKLFAASDGKIFEVTNPASTTVPPAASVTGRTSNYYAHVQYATVAGEFTIAVNGSDLHLVYNGTAWAANVPAITSLDPSFTSSADWSHVWTFKNRLWFVQKGSKNAWYLPVDSLGGAAKLVSLAGVFIKGGSLLFGGTWSVDAGDGLDDKCVFVSTNGEAAVYEGTDPSDPAKWSLIGRYDISRPLGMNATMKAGGDFLMACADGLIPISASLQKDPAALSLAAISNPIEPDWKRDVRNRITRPWEIIKWVERNMAIIAAPPSYTPGTPNVLTQDAYCYVVNLQSGKWARYTGWDVQSIGLLNGQVFFGTSQGKVMRAEAGGNDDGLPYVCRMCGVFEMVKGGPALKSLKQARATWTYGANFLPRVDFAVNYIVDFGPAPPALVSLETASVWDLAIWDVSRWSVEPGFHLQNDWVSIGKAGYAIAPMIQVTCGDNLTPDGELLAIDVTFGKGAVVV